MSFPNASYDAWNDPDAILKNLGDYLESLGAKRMSYHFAPAFSSMVNADILLSERGFDPAWIALYRDPEFRAADPIPDFVVEQGRPMRWRTAANLTRDRPNARQFFLKFDQMKMGDGVAMPLVASNGYSGFGSMSFNRDVRAEDENVLLHMRERLQHAHMRIVEIAQVRRRSLNALSAREREVLCCVARGMNNRQVAQALRITAASVDTYLRRIFSKLDVSDRVSATVRALSLGLIRF
jgi:DNA-binding CsgD family transcriptional regulator